MKRIILVISIILFSIGANAQNVTMAKAFFKKAQKEYENNNYGEAITLLEKTIENLNGETNPDIIYLEGKSRFYQESNITKSVELFKQFLNEADRNDERIDEISSILVDIETSDAYYSNGLKKRHSLTTKNGNKTLFFYLRSGFLSKVEEYGKDRDFKLSKIRYFSGETKANRKIIRVEYYDEKKNFESVDYYLNDTQRLKIWDNGEHIHVWNDNGRFIQRYGYKNNDYITEVSGSLYSFESFNGWDDYTAYLEISGGCFIEETYNEFKSIKLVDQHKDLLVGTVKILRTGYYGYNDNDYYKYYFNEEGIPEKKEYYKRDKLKDSFTFNIEDNSWVKE